MGRTQNRKNIILLNGQLSEEQKISSINSPHSQYGIGFFETILYREGRIFFLNEHIERIKKTCRDFNISVKTDLDISPCSKESILKLIKANALTEKSCRIKIIYAPLTSKDSPVKESSVKGGKWSTVITVTPYSPRKNNFNKKDFQITIHNEVYESKLNKYKSINYHYNHYWREYYSQQGFDEVLFCNSKGNILEGSFTNVIVFKNDGKKGTIFFADKKNPYLAGIAQDKVLELAEREGYKIEARPEGIEPDLLKSADRVYLTNSLMVIQEVGSIVAEEQILFHRQNSSEGLVDLRDKFPGNRSKHGGSQLSKHI